MYCKQDMTIIEHIHQTFSDARTILKTIHDSNTEHERLKPRIYFLNRGIDEAYVGLFAKKVSDYLEPKKAAKFNTAYINLFGPTETHSHNQKIAFTVCSAIVYCMPTNSPGVLDYQNIYSFYGPTRLLKNINEAANTVFGLNIFDVVNSIRALPNDDCCLLFCAEFLNQKEKYPSSWVEQYDELAKYIRSYVAGLDKTDHPTDCTHENKSFSDFFHNPAILSEISFLHGQAFQKTGPTRNMQIAQRMKPTIEKELLKMKFLHTLNSTSKPSTL